MRSVLGAISDATTNFGLACTTTSMPKLCAADARRASPLDTTTPTTSTPCSLSIFSVITPKWGEPTRGIRMVVLPKGVYAKRRCDNTPRATVGKGGRGVLGYQQQRTGRPLAGIARFRSP